MAKHFLNPRIMMTFAFMLVVTVGLSSCETLKKKFTRHKKENQVQDFQPVLEPENYPAPDKNPREIYKQHYDLIKAWYNDLWTGVDEKSYDGPVKYSLKQILDHLEQMKLLLKSEKAQGLNKLESLLSFYQASLDHPRPVRNYAHIQSDLRAFHRILVNQYRYDAIKGDLNG